MVFIGVKFEETMEDINKYAMILRENSAKQVPLMLFDTTVFVLHGNVLVMWKDFVARKTMSMIYLIMIIGSIIPFLVWGTLVPVIIVGILAFIFYLFDSAWFNFFMLKLMLKKNGYKGKVKLL